MANNCSCGEVCRRCGGCKAQHYKKENREYLGCDGYLPSRSQSARKGDA